MAKYAVALFLEKEDNSLPGKTITMRRLQQHIVTARNGEEALGIVMHDTSRKDRDFPIHYHTTTRISK